MGKGTPGQGKFKQRVLTTSPLCPAGPRPPGLTPGKYAFDNEILVYALLPSSGMRSKSELKKLSRRIRLHLVKPFLEK
jgi:hypothetical protein